MLQHAAFTVTIPLFCLCISKRLVQEHEEWVNFPGRRLLKIISRGDAASCLAFHPWEKQQRTAANRKPQRDKSCILQDSHMCGKLIAHCSSSILGNLASSLPRSHTLNRDHIPVYLLKQPRRQNGTTFGWSSVRRQKIAKLYSFTWFHLRRCLQTKHNCLERSDKTLTWLMDMVFCWRLYAYSTKPEFRRQKSV